MGIKINNSNQNPQSTSNSTKRIQGPKADYELLTSMEFIVSEACFRKDADGYGFLRSSDYTLLEFHLMIFIVSQSQVKLLA